MWEMDDGIDSRGSTFEIVFGISTVVRHRVSCIEWTQNTLTVVRFEPCFDSAAENHRYTMNGIKV